MEPLGLYIHIPFCKSKCYYCDFLSYSHKDSFMDKYIKYINKEIDLYSDILKDSIIETIFIGGGTPSHISEVYISRILKNINRKLDISKVNEITIEANPCTLNEEKLNVYNKLGVNRISLGVQSMDNKVLKKIGRIHTEEDIYKSYNLIKKTGFENVNIDLIFGLPDQKLEGILETLKKIVDLNVEHISFYSLIIEEGTKYYTWLDEGKISLPEEKLERQMYHKGKEYLIENGYEHYEISNFAKKGFESKHNVLYWTVKPYVGLGIGAHSNLNNIRYWNWGDFESYFKYIDEKRLPIEGRESINKEMEMAEYAMLGLRLAKGISKGDFFNRFHKNIEKVYGDVLKKHERNNLLKIDKDRIKLTNKGLDLANIVFIDLFPNKK